MKQAAAILCLIFLAGCSPILYAPNTLNVPMIAGKGEGNAAVHWGDEETIQVEGAYSPLDHLGVLVDWTHARVQDRPDGSGGSMSMWEGGVGRYQRLGRPFFWDAYGILAFGKVENHAPSSVSAAPGTTGTLDARFIRYGLQPSIGWRSRFFDLSFSSRLAALHYYAIDGSMVLNAMSAQDYLMAHRNHFLVEPALTARAGIDFLKVQVQLGQSYNITYPDFFQRQEIKSWGIIYNFGR